MTTPSNAIGSGSGTGKVLAILVPVVLIALGLLYLVTRSTQNPTQSTSQTSDKEAVPGGPSSGETGQPAPPDDGTGVAPADTAQSIMRSARQAINEQRAARAVELLRAGVEQYDVDQTMYAMLGEALALDGRRSEALQAYEKAVFLQDDAGLRDMAASIAESLGDTEKAALHWARARELDASNPKYPLYQAVALRKLNKHEEAAPLFLAAATLDASLHQAWASLAGIAMDAGRLGPALQHIQRAREVRPNEPLYLLTEATIRLRMGQAERGASLLMEIDERVRMRDDRVLMKLAECYGALREPDRAVRLYQEASRMRPEDASVFFELALWHERVGSNDEARAAAQRAVDLGDERATAMVERLNADG